MMYGKDRMGDEANDKECHKYILGRTILGTSEDIDGENT